METRIVITGDHPHTGETGVVKRNKDGKFEVVSIFGRESVEIILDNCPHGMKSCYAGKGNLALIEP